MRLKRLEVFGFKSFADRVEFDFGPGLTGIVGPNGCGKSNVVDAVRWVLGEQRPTQLRGSEMTDVIFKGTSFRSPLGFAEVSVVLDNEGGGLPSEYAEVSFTRRLFRTGESEYLLNRQPARLRDFRDLLLDTGLGVHSYTILEQGKIDAILAANPVERRTIFEEAAGISKFRIRRKEAVRKIEQVLQNLLRLQDLLAELEHGIRSLKIQAGKARRYREFQERLRDLRIALGLHLYRMRSTELGEARRVRVDLEGEVARLRVGRERMESEIRLLEEEEGILAGEASRELAALEGVKEEEAQAADRINALEVRTGEWERERRAAEERMVAVSGQFHGKEEEGTRLLGELARARESLAAAQRTLAEKEGKARDAAQGSREAAAGLERADREVVEFLHLRTEAQNRRLDLEVKLKGLHTECERLAARRAEIVQALAWRRRQEIQLAGEREGFESREREVEEGIQDLAVRSEEAEAKCADQERRLLDTEQRFSALSSRYQVLRELAEGKEGLDGGVKALLRRGGEVSLLADRIQIDLRFARALESALMGRAQSLVVFDPRSALEGMAHLRQAREGRAAFALPGRAGPVPPAAAVPQVPGVLGRLLEEVRCEAALRPLLEQWIGDCVLVEGAERAAALAERHPGLRFATPDGDLFGNEFWIGGEAVKESGPISRRSLVEALEAELRSLGAERDCLALSRDEARRAVSAIRSEQDRLGQQKGLASRELAVRRAGLDQQRGEIARLEEEKRLLEKELGQLEDETSRASELVRHFAAEWESLERRFQEANAELKRLNAAKASQDALREEASRALGEARVEAERLRGIEQKILGQRELLGGALEDLRVEGDRLEAVVVESLQRIEAARREVESLHASRARSLEERGRLEGVVHALREREQGVQAKVRQSRAEVEGRSQELEALLGKLSEARLEEQKIEIARAEVSSRIRDEFQAELADLAASRAPDPAFDPAAADREAAELREKAERLGSINLDAVRDLEEKEGRFQFLTSQRKDLEEARGLLQETIRRIDEESRERFSATFQVVQEQFQVIFRQLFRGGKAELLLEEGADLLEAGILIHAKPPGKELRNIDLLSGGERTLTALALLFALFRSKPSPFCLLDEVDAALDDANIERFLAVLEEFTRGSQFVLVTHNKRTMTACGRLYGVTMQDNGVSKKVGVELGGEGDEIRFIPAGRAIFERRPEPAIQPAEGPAG